jgi:hypothetical protein
MPSTFVALAVTVAALLPGALYVWGLERQVGRWGIGLSDRVLRFIGGSAVFHALFAPLTYWFIANRLHSVLNLEPMSLWWWLAPVLYVAVPFGSGSLVGLGALKKWRWTRWVLGPDPAPRAWDYLFERGLDGWIRVRLKSGTWLGGAFASANNRESYASGYPETQELYLAAAVPVDPETGEFQFDGDEVTLLPGGLLLKWEDIEYLEFIDAQERGR